jgi:hypothetical protein
MSTTQAHESDLLLYGCTGWRKSSQAAYNLYRGGTKLWTKAALLDIEQQLAQSKTRRIFTVRSIDGTVISIVNPMFGEQHPIW